MPAGDAPIEKRGRFKSGRVWKEPRTPAGRRVRDRALKTTWRKKMKLKESRELVRRLEVEAKALRLEKLKKDRARRSATEKKKAENQRKNDKAQSKKRHFNPKKRKRLRL